MEQSNIEKLRANEQKYQTLDDYINLAERLGLRLSVEDMMEIKKSLQKRKAEQKE